MVNDAIISALKLLSIIYYDCARGVCALESPSFSSYRLHGKVHPNECHVTDLLVVDLHSSLAYFTMTHLLLVASKLPIKLWLLGNYQQMYMCVCT